MLFYMYQWCVYIKYTGRSFDSVDNKEYDYSYLYHEDYERRINP